MIQQAIPVVTSAVTLVGMWLAGNKDYRAWIVGLVNQALWLATIIMFRTWGLLLLTAALIVIYTRNLIRWRRG